MPMKNLKLGTQLNISFALVLLVPMLVATVFSIVYYSNKIREEAVNTIGSDLKIADLIYRHAVDNMGNLADAYAQKKTLTVLLGLNMGEKLGKDLARSAAIDGLDMVTVVDRTYRVLVRSHAPRKIHDAYAPRPYIAAALSGETVSGTEILSGPLAEEGRFLADSPADPAPMAITGAAPVYDRQRENIVGAIVVRRIIDEESAIVGDICRNLNINAALFKKERLIASCSVQETGDDFVHPAEETLRSVLSGGDPVSIARIGNGGSIAKLAPIPDFNAEPVGVLMVQRGVDAYLHTRNVAIATLLSIFLVGFLLALIIKTIVVRRIVVPVQRLKKGTERIGQGEYGHRVDATSGDEIGELTGAFNTMAEDLQAYDGQLKEYNLQLEERVRERTEELQVANRQLTEANAVLEETLERLNPGVSRLIGSNRQQLGLVYATELVSDVCNYTKLNMILGETLMGEFMKKFFRESHKLLAQYRGMFDKTVGDQIVAIFGTPKDDSPASPVHAFDAIACAIKLIQASEEINRIMQTAIQDNYTAIAARHQSLSSEDRKTIRIEDLRFQCRVGINTSNPTSDREIDRMRMVMMGAETCIDYTAQGGAVIYAFRLESNGTPGEIHIGENAKRLVDHVYRLEDMPPITLKGLGVQPGYRVVGEGSLFENIYPKTRFYRRYAEDVPEVLTRLAATLTIGRIQIREVQRINQFLDVGIPYVEHMTGCYNLSISRALLAHAAGAHRELPEPRLDALIFSALWQNALSLSRIGLETLIPNAIASQVPEGMDADLVTAVVGELDARRPVLEEARIIAICNQFDEMVFDRTYLKGRAREVLTSKEVLSLMRIEAKYDADLIDAMAFLMVAPEAAGGEEESVVRREPIHLPRNPAVLAEAIRKHLPESAIQALFAHLRSTEN